MDQEGFLTYLYCFCKEKPLLPEINFNQKLSLMVIDGFYAVIESVPVSEFGEQVLQTSITDMEWLVPKVNIHEGVIHYIMDQTTVLPVKFATIFSDKHKIEKLVNANKAAYQTNFTKLKNRQEWGVKVYSSADETWLVKNTTDSELLALKETIDQASPGKAFMLKKKMETLINAKKSGIYKKWGKELYLKLKENTEISFQKSILPTQVAKNTKDKMLLNAVFLVQESEVENWLQEIKVIEQEIDNNNITFNVSGPWPPYHFMN